MANYCNVFPKPGAGPPGWICPCRRRNLRCRPGPSGGWFVICQGRNPAARLRFCPRAAKGNGGERLKRVVFGWRRGGGNRVAAWVQRGCQGTKRKAQGGKSFYEPVSANETAASWDNSRSGGTQTQGCFVSGCSIQSKMPVPPARANGEITQGFSLAGFPAGRRE